MTNNKSPYIPNSLSCASHVHELHYVFVFKHGVLNDSLLKVHIRVWGIFSIFPFFPFFPFRPNQVIWRKRRFSHSSEWGLSVLTAAVWDVEAVWKNAAGVSKLKLAQLLCRSRNHVKGTSSSNRPPPTDWWRNRGHNLTSHNGSSYVD